MHSLRKKRSGFASLKPLRRAGLVLSFSICLPSFASLADQSAPASESPSVAPPLESSDDSRPVVPSVPEPPRADAPGPLPTSSAPQVEASPPGRPPRFAVGLNVLEPVLYSVGAGTTTHNKAMLTPVPVDFHARVSDVVGINGTLLYRYFRDGSRLALHEIAAAAGPRLSFTGNGLEGFYVAAKVGLGVAVGHDYSGRDYSRIDLVLQSEFGYAIAFASGVYLVAGAGVLSLFPLKQDPGPISWNSLGKMFQYYQPVVNLTLGFAL
jgi:hypothetical protein